MAKLGDVLGNLLTSTIGKGVEAFLHIMGKSMKPYVLPILREGEKQPDLPPIIRDIIARLSATGSEGGEAAAGLITSLGMGAAGQVGGAALSPWLELIKQGKSEAIPFQRFPPLQAAILYLRKLVNIDFLQKTLMLQGWGKETLPGWVNLAERILDIAIAMDLWRRGEWTEKRFEIELKDQLISGDRIEDIKKLKYVLPNVQDLILMAVREAFTPEIAEKFGQYQDFPDKVMEWAEKLGISKELMILYWAAHWLLPSSGQGFDMLHRGIIDEKELKLLLRALDVMPFWRDKLIDLSWDLPSRIEIRMMARYLNLDKDYIVDLLTKAGLKEEYRSNAADFMIVMGLQGYWSDLYRNRWLTAEELKAEITAKKLSPDIAERVYKTIVKAEAPARTEEAKKLTEARILKGLKEEVISPSETVQLLMEHRNYAQPEAEFIVAVEIAAMGSPETPLEFRQLVELGKKAEGKPYKEIPQECIDTEKKLLELRRRLSDAKVEKASQEVIDKLTADEATAKVTLDILKTNAGLQQLT